MNVNPTATPAPDTFDLERFPHGVEAGRNKYGFTVCPICKKPPTCAAPGNVPWNLYIPAAGLFMFKDQLSAKEYGLSGMCQACQDTIFEGDDDHDD